MMPVYRDSGGAHYLVQLRLPPQELDLSPLNDYTRDAILVNDVAYMVAKKKEEYQTGGHSENEHSLVFYPSSIYVSGKDPKDVSIFDEIAVVRYFTLPGNYSNISGGTDVTKWFWRTFIAFYGDKNLEYAKITCGGIPALPNYRVIKKLKDIDINLKNLEKEGKCVWLEGTLRMVEMKEPDEFLEDGFYSFPHSHKYI